MMNRREFSLLPLALAAAKSGEAQLAGPQLPRRAPELDIKLPGGRDVLLSSNRGKVVVVAFVFTTCPHCQDATRILNKLYKEYGPRGFQPLGAAFNDMAMLLVPEFVTFTGATFPIGVAARQTVLDFLQYPDDKRLLVPTMAFLDRQGMIQQQSPLDAPPGVDFHSEANLRQIIEKLLNSKTGSDPAATKKQTVPLRKTSAPKK